MRLFPVLNLFTAGPLICICSSCKQQVYVRLTPSKVQCPSHRDVERGPLSDDVAHSRDWNCRQQLSTLAQRKIWQGSATQTELVSGNQFTVRFVPFKGPNDNEQNVVSLFFCFFLHDCIHTSKHCQQKQDSSLRGSVSLMLS